MYESRLYAFLHTFLFLQEKVYSLKRNEELMIVVVVVEARGSVVA
jgi:hypothetical protein